MSRVGFGEGFCQDDMGTRIELVKDHCVYVCDRDRNEWHTAVGLPLGEYSHTLRPASELADLRAANTNRILRLRAERGQIRDDTTQKRTAPEWVCSFVKVGK